MIQTHPNGTTRNKFYFRTRPLISRIVNKRPTRPLEKRERPKLTEDSAVGVSNSVEDGGVGGDVEDEQWMRERGTLSRLVPLGSHVLVLVLVLILEFDKRNKKKWWYRARVATAIDGVSPATVIQFIHIHTALLCESVTCEREGNSYQPSKFF